MEDTVLRRLRVVARSIVIVLILVWLWFGISSAWSEGGWVNWVLHLLIPGGILLITLLVAIKWEAVGASLLIGEGVFLSIWVLWSASISTTGLGVIVFLLCILGLPLTIAGGLLLTTSRWEGRVESAGEGEEA